VGTSASGATAGAAAAAVGSVGAGTGSAAGEATASDLDADGCALAAVDEVAELFCFFSLSAKLVELAQADISEKKMSPSAEGSLVLLKCTVSHFLSSHRQKLPQTVPDAFFLFCFDWLLMK
jgi:hypothetical protein